MAEELIPPHVLEALEERYLRPIERAAKLEALFGDPLFHADPVNHPALFSDHGPIHVRDVAACFLDLTQTLNGLLLSRRPPDRLSFIAAYGLLATYLHDVGMHDQTREGRRLHPVFAAQVVFGDGVDDVVEEVLAADGPVAARLHAVHAEAPFQVEPAVALRELLSLTLVHSKSVVPAHLLEDRESLRRLAQRAVLMSLEAHRGLDRPLHALKAEPFEPSANAGWWDDPLEQSFAWLVSDERAQQDLADDVIDALRMLRVADALRQRGTRLRTTGGYEVLVDAATGDAVFSLRTEVDGHLYLLRGDSPKSAGEANLRAVTVTGEGQVRIAFHRGAYLSPEAEHSAAASTALVIGDILADVVPALAIGRVSVALPPPAVGADQIRAQLERPRDNPGFADLVVRLIAEDRPDLADRTLAVDAELASPEGVTQEEWQRFHRGTLVDPHSEEARACLEELARRGAQIEGMDVDAAFSDVRRVRVSAGEVVMPLGSPSGFVYVPTGPGLHVQPTGGYPPVALTPWVPVGTTGVIRRAERNGDVTAEQDLELLVIPGEAYVRTWFRPYGPVELVDLFERTYGA